MIYALYGALGRHFWRPDGIRVKWKPVFGQSPVPGFGEKYFSNLPSLPSNSFASGGDSFFWVMFGQLLAYSVFTSSHFSRPGSVSGLRAFGLAHAAIDAFVRMDDQHVLALVEAVHGAHLDAVGIFALDAGFSDDVSHPGLRNGQF
jgi:hypothetical protein